jgi:hypothetical protein
MNSSFRNESRSEDYEQRCPPKSDRDAQAAPYWIGNESTDSKETFDSGTGSEDCDVTPVASGCFSDEDNSDGGYGQHSDGDDVAPGLPTGYEYTDSQESFASRTGSEEEVGEVRTQQYAAEVYSHEQRSIASEDTGGPGVFRRPSTPSTKLDLNMFDVDYQNFQVEPCERVLRQLCGAKVMIAGLRSDAAAGLNRLRRGGAADPGVLGEEDADADVCVDDEDNPTQTAGAGVEVVLVNSPVYVYIKFEDAAAVYRELRKWHPAVCGVARKQPLVSLTLWCLLVCLCVNVYLD